MEWIRTETTFPPPAFVAKWHMTDLRSQDLSAPDDQALDRIQQNVLAAKERQLLNWLCARMPAWVTPDILTSFGMAGAFMTFIGYVASNYGPGWLLLSIAGYFVQWFGDLTDGSLARFRKIERPSYGYFVDHSCDGLTVFLILFGMGLSPYVTLDYAMLALAGYLLLCIHAFLSARVMGELKLSYLNAGPTELRFLLIGITVMFMVLGSRGPGLFGTFSGFDLFVGIVGVILIILFILQTLVTSKKLAKMDPGPQR